MWARLMAIGSPPIGSEKHKWQNVGILLGSYTSAQPLEVFFWVPATSSNNASRSGRGGRQCQTSTD